MAEAHLNASFDGDNGLAGTEKKTFLNGYVFGAPMKDLGILATLLMSFAVAFAAFFCATFVAIVSLLIWNAGHGPAQQEDYALTYRWALPVGLAVLVFALSYLGMLWVRRQVSRR
jgi:hypothetical protein